MLIGFLVGSPNDTHQQSKCKMKSFSDFNIRVSVLTGEKIKIAEVIDKEIVVEDFRIEESKYKKGNIDKCLTIQFTISGERRIVFTSSDVLLQQIQKVPSEGFPFKTRITRQGKMYQFT